MSRVVLLTGGNLGPVAENLTRAREEVAREIGPVVRCSSVGESEAWGFEAKERFLNQVLEVETELSPEEVLNRCQTIETRLGRVRLSGGRYASRTMDIDILFYDALHIRTDRLTVPHPLIDCRLFVLVLLDELMPDRRIPPSERTVHQLCLELDEKQRLASASTEEMQK